jgi:hypothetical protein
MIHHVISNPSINPPFHLLIPSTTYMYRSINNPPIYRSLHLPLLLSTNLLPSTHNSINPFSITRASSSIYPSSNLFILPSTYISICLFFRLSLFHITSFPPFPSSTLIKKKIKFSSYISKFRVEPLQSHI